MRDLASRIDSLLEKIQHPPRNVLVFIKKVRRKVEPWKAEALGLHRVFKNQDPGIAGDFFHSVGIKDANFLSSLRSRAFRVSGSIGESEKWMLEVIDTIIRDESNNGYVSNAALRHLIDDMKSLRKKVLSDIDDVIDDARVAMAASGNRYAKAEDEYKEELPKEFFLSVRGIVGLVDSILKVSDDVEKKLAEYVRIRSPWGDEKPKHEKVETLYHASVFAKSIEKKGFSLRGRRGGYGLGGSQSNMKGNRSISFTSDLHVAKEAARGLKEAIMIARGEVKAWHILDWAKRERIVDDVKKIYASSWGNEPIDTPLKAMYLYRGYLAFSKRPDPVFFGDMRELMRRFKKMNPRYVGVIVAKVDLSDPDILYNVGEREFRVQPKDVVSIEGVIR